MADYDTDEEQIEAIKRWWRENGSSLLIGIGLVLLAVFGWRQWESSQGASAAAASDLYQQLAQLASGNPALEMPEEDFSTAQFLNEQLRSEHAKSVYAKYAALFMAKLHVDAGDLDAAAADLTWIIDNPSLGLLQEVEEELLFTARLRLARVVLAQGDAQRALDLLRSMPPGPAFDPLYAEAEGDALLALGQTAEAREAYRRAVNAGTGNVLVELKLRDLGGA